MAKRQTQTADRFDPPPLETWTPARTDAQVDAAVYEGPEARQQRPWKCPACGVENLGPLPLGCTSCGAGKPGYHVGLERPVTPTPTEPVTARPDRPLLEAAQAWLDAHPAGSPIQAFIAGYLMARAEQRLATTEVERFAPAGKPRRTIIAALQLFRDQVLPDAAAEIESGEWLTAEETDRLIADLEAARD